MSPAVRRPCDGEGVILLAVLHVDEVSTADRESEAQLVFGTTNPDPGVGYLLQRTNPCYVSGRLEGLALPHHDDLRTLRQTPAELRDQFSKPGWTKVGRPGPPTPSPPPG